jgi:ADP-ribosylglycohydrolase
MAHGFLARRFVCTSKAPVCLCTNLGGATESVAAIAGIRAARVVMRPITAHSPPNSSAAPRPA